MAPPKGSKRPPGAGGSRKGKPNRTTADIKQMILNALTKAGGERYLTDQAHKNPTAFLGLLGKIMPLQVNGSGNVLLIEQLCLIANTEWQRKRALANGGGQTIDAEPDKVEIGDTAEPKIH